MTSALLKRIENRLRRELFLTTPLSIIINPVYITRSGLLKAISKHAPALGGDVLDFGCGSKPYETLFVNAKSYTGVDIKVSGHDHRDSKIDHFYDGKTLPFPSQYFDSIVCFEVLEHIFNLDEVMFEIGRVLKPEGKLLISLPFAWDEHEVPFDFARYTSFGIKYILERHKFEILDHTKTNTYILAIYQLFIEYLAKNVSPRSGIGKRLFQLIIIFPLNVWSVCMNFMFPKSYDYFTNHVVLSKKCG